MPALTYDFFMGQVRLIAVGVIAWLGGSGRLSAADASAATAVLVPVGLLIGPWLWSVYRNFGMKLVPHDSIAVSPLVPGTTLATGDHIVIQDAKFPDAGTSQAVAKVVGALLLAIMLPLWIDPAMAQTQAKTPVDPAINLAVKLQILTPEKLQAALDDAEANGDPYSPNCYRALIPLAQAAQASNAVASAKPKGTPVANINMPLIYQKLRDMRRAAQTLQNALNGGAQNTDIVVACAPMALDSATVINMVIGQIGSAALLVPK